MSPRFLFRIDEIAEDPNGPVMVNNNPLLPAANWIPCISRGTIRYQSEGASGIWWLCNGQGIKRVPGNQLPRGTTYFKSISMFFCDGFGFLLYRGDATRPNDQGTLQPLRFDHYTQDYSSYLTEAGQYSALICRRSDQEWVQRLLPDIYHGQIETPYQQYGALKGDLGILLGLIAFALHKDMLQVYLPSMFVQGEWKTYNTINGRTHQRGVVVYIYTCPSNWPVNGSQGSTEHDLSAYEDGAWGKYYN